MVSTVAGVNLGTEWEKAYYFRGANRSNTRRKESSKFLRNIIQPSIQTTIITVSEFDATRYITALCIVDFIYVFSPPDHFDLGTLVHIRQWRVYSVGALSNYQLPTALVQCFPLLN